MMNLLRPAPNRPSLWLPEGEAVVRDATRRDTAALVRLWWTMMQTHKQYDPRFAFDSRATRDVERRIHESIRNRDSLLLVTEIAGEVVGYIQAELHQRRPVYPVGSYGFIAEISVDEPWKRHGIGRRLVDDAIQWFHSRGVTSVELFAAESNPHSQAFWTSIGFTGYLRLLRREIQFSDK